MAQVAMNTGLRFGAYEIETLLGPGGVTETYRAHKTGSTDPVALKLLRPDRGGAETRVAMAFKNLAFRNRQLQIAGIARVIDVSTDPANTFLVTELVSGLDMEALLDSAAASGTLEPERVADIGRQIATILGQLHKRTVPVVHGGLCPGNVIMNDAGQVVLTDVGYSAALRNLTEFAIDKWWFVAPELLRDAKAKPTPVADVYALGAVLYFLLSGEAPLMADTRDDLLQQIDEEPPAIVGAPDWLAAAVAQMLSRDPAQRPASAEGVLRLLSPGQNEGPAPPPLAPAMTMMGFAAPAAPALQVAPEPDDELPSLDLLDDVTATAAVDPTLPAMSAGVDLLSDAGNWSGGAALSEPLSLAPTPAPQSAPALIVPTSQGSFAADPLEPQWVDEPPAALGAGGASAVDDFLGLPPPPARAAVLSAQAPIDAPLDLPDLPAAGPKVVDLPMTVRAGQAEAGIHGDEDRVGGPIDINQVGVVDYGEGEDDDDAGSSSSGSRRSAGLPVELLPRRAGSARVGAAAQKKKVSPTLVIGVLAVVGGGVFAVQKLMAPERVVVAPPPPRKNESKPVDTATDREAAAREKAQAEAVAPAMGQLTVETTPRGATVWIDGVERGRTPLTIESKPGGHRIVITKPGFKMLREVADTTEGLTIKRTLPPANINFGGTVKLKVECKTEGKYPVFIDGRDTGLLCPVEDLLIPEGNRLIGLYVIPQNKIWSFERDVIKGSQQHRVIFSY